MLRSFAIHFQTEIEYQTLQSGSLKHLMESKLSWEPGSSVVRCLRAFQTTLKEPKVFLMERPVNRLNELPAEEAAEAKTLTTFKRLVT